VSALSASQQYKGNEVRVFGLDSAIWEKHDKFFWKGAPVESFKVFCGTSSFGFAPDLAKALTRFDPEIIHVHGLWMYPSLVVWRWHKKTGKPYVYSPHGMLSSVALSYSKWKKFIVRRFFQDAALAQASVLHATTESEAEEFRRFGLKSRIDVVPHGVQNTAVPIVKAESFKRILSLGRMHPMKGLDRLIEAWSRLENNFPEWCLDLVGPDEEGCMADLQALATSLNVRRVTFRPSLQEMERNECMASAEFFVLPTRSENFALTVAESLMMETPVISTHGAPWYGLEVEKCGWWIEHGVDQLAKTMEQAMLLTDGQRHIMGKNGRAWMLRDFVWDSVADKMLNVYKGVISASNKR
jgi:glycosyltransferase involved in cell wall biosynthesis